LATKYEGIDAAIRQFIEAQQMFFVASAPLDANGHVNVSPKGLDTFRVLGPKTVAYLDLTGSGIETVAHVKENGRIVLMFCAFQGAPKILRLYGRGRVVEPGDAEFSEMRGQFPDHAGVRSIVVVELTDIIDSCGFGVPLYRYEGQREQHGAWARKVGPEGIRTYQQKNNRGSLDGLSGVSAND
jgi:Pyridoxamine 5'-phosphate oxidase